MSETLQPALPDDLDERAEALMKAVCDREWTVATAESCTGGMLAALLTDIEGASHGFERGFVSMAGRGPVRIKTLRCMLEMLEESLDRS